VDPAGLSRPERALWTAFGSGRWVDLRSRDPARDELSQAESWGARRVIRAEVVKALLLGASHPEAGQVPAVRLRGARITGRIDLMGAVIPHPLVLEQCWLEEPPRFVEATTKTIRITASRLPGLNGARMRTEGILNLYQSVISDVLRLDRARVAGEITLRGARLGPAAGGRGPAPWPGHDTHEVLACAGLSVDGDMECNAGCVIDGAVNLRGARIGGLLTFEGAVLEGDGSAVHLSRLQAGELNLRLARPAAGPIRLEQAHVSVLDDDAATWPPQIWLNGFTYGNIRHGSARVPARERIDWVSRGPFGYQPQPYEELAGYYRRMGHDDDVRRVLLAKQRHRRGTLSLPGRVAGRLLDVTVGYGYRPWLAAVWLVLLLTVGTVAFAAGRPHPLPGGPVPPYSSFAYTLDLLIPFGAFGLRQAYGADGAGQWLGYALIASGWILATAVIAGITSAVRRD
jgi:hypothetical protein